VEGNRGHISTVNVTTVQRWEKREGMPVHRHLHDRMGSVYAFRAEYGPWAHSRESSSSAGERETISPRPIPLPFRRASARWTSLTQMDDRIARLARGAALAIGASLWLQRTEYFWRSPSLTHDFRTVTESDGVEQAAAVSRDGHFVAFLSDRGRTDGRLGYAGRFGDCSTT